MSYELIYTLIDNDTHYSVSGYRGDPVDVVIPNEYEGKAVTSIGNDAFRSRSSLTSIEIPDSVTSIGSYAFSGTSLTSIEIPDSVTRISSSAFNGCGSLASINIGNSVTSIGFWAFRSCISLTKVNYTGTIDQWVQIEFETYDANPLYYAKNLYINDVLVTEINITTATKINPCAFYNCTSLKSVTIGDSVTSIGSSAFYGCSLLESMTIPYVGATKDGTSGTHFGYIFGAGSSTYNNDYVPTSLKEVIITGGASIDVRAFWCCTSLTSIEIPNSITSIEEEAFYGCTSLTSIAIPDSVTSIGEAAFKYCSSLTSIDIPDSITNIGNLAFWECNSALYTTENDLTYVKANGSNYCILIGARHYPSTYSINSSTKYIAYGVFSGFERLSTITIPDSVISISAEAFYKCTSLSSVTIPDSVKSIGKNAFDKCPIETATIPAFAYRYIKNTKLKEVVITSGTSIPKEAFSDCSSLTSVTIPDSVKKIGENAFYNCNSLTKVNYTGTTDEWVQIEFYDIASNPLHYIANLYINDILVTEANLMSATKINNYAFYNCGSLTSVVIGDGVTSIGDYAFYYCDSLTSVVIGNSVTSIGWFAFNGCNSLTSVVIPNSVTSISDYAFYECKSLSSVTIGNSVMSISIDAFAYCTSLNTINIISKVPANLTIGAFDNISRDVKFYCYSSALEAYKTATNWSAYKNNFIADDLRLAFIAGTSAQKNYFASKSENKYIENKIDELNLENGEGKYSIKTKVPKGNGGSNEVLGKGSSAFGRYLKEKGEYNFNQGYYNEVKGNNNALFGYRNTIVNGNTNVLSGYWNIIGLAYDKNGKQYGSVNFVSGWSNTVYGDYNTVFGRDHTLGSLNSPWVSCTLIGRGHDPRQSGQILFGTYSKAWGGVNFAIGNGSNVNGVIYRSNSFDINTNARARSYPNEKALNEKPNDNDILIRKEVKELAAIYKHKLTLQTSNYSYTLYLILSNKLDTNNAIDFEVFSTIVKNGNENFIALYGYAESADEYIVNINTSGNTTFSIRQLSSSGYKEISYQSSEFKTCTLDAIYEL